MNRLIDITNPMASRLYTDLNESGYFEVDDTNVSMHLIEIEVCYDYLRSAI